jgi:hypothetical protein
VSAVGALVVGAAFAWQSAYAGFTDTTPALTVSIGTGTIAVSNDVVGYGALTLPAMRPGDSDTRCIVVSSTGSEPAQVRLYATDKTSSPTALARYLTFTWLSGTGGGAHGDCTGFVADGGTLISTMSSFRTTYGSGYLSWNTAGGAAAETRTYQLTYQLSTSAPSTTKGGSAALTFVWEARQR